MESFAKPLRQLDEDAVWFARATELDVFHVTCSADIRSSALKVISAIEFHPDNRSPVIVLEDAWMTADHGWNMRARRMAELWEGRVRVLAESGIELGSLSGHHPASTDPLGAFGGWLRLVDDAIRAPLEGLVLVLAPTRVEDPEAFEDELLGLIARPELSATRWVIVDVEEAPFERLHRELGERALRATCIRDEDAFARDLHALMTSVDPEMPGPARAGAAWPRGVIPPPRPGEVQPTEETQEAVDIELAAAGMNPSLAGEQGVRMQQYVIAAAVSLKEGHHDKALEHQAEACRIAYDSGARREALIQHLVLAGYTLSAQRDADAYREYVTVSERAEGWGGCLLEHAHANMALGLMEMQRSRSAEAATHYAAAAESARKVDATGLAIECWRLAGQMAAEADLDERAAECFQRALELAEEASPNIAKSSSAPRAARQLAARMRKRGGAEQATSLELTANRLEEGMPRSVEEML